MQHGYFSEIYGVDREALQLKWFSIQNSRKRNFTRRLRKGFAAFGKKMKGYYTEEANIIGVESRTSSPVNIPRNETLEHPQISNLFPCGEGGGYAGGIISAAMDGERCAEAAIERL